MTLNPNDSICPACSNVRPAGELQAGDVVPASVVQAIRAEHPQWSPEQMICDDCVSEGKARHAADVIASEIGRMGPSEAAVVESIRTDRILAGQGDQTDSVDRYSAERWADVVADLVGSWRFSMGIVVGIGLWFSWNWFGRPFEPFPTVALAGASAGLATLAAMQGPVILMSQRRQRRRDRLRAESDYRVNLKAELEIRYLDEKINRMLQRQNELLERLERETESEQS
jgi:uncharacterized membrane protein